MSSPEEIKKQFENFNQNNSGTPQIPQIPTSGQFALPQIPSIPVTGTNPQIPSIPQIGVGAIPQIPTIPQVDSAAQFQTSRPTIKPLAGLPQIPVPKPVGPATSGFHQSDEDTDSQFHSARSSGPSSSNGLPQIPAAPTLPPIPTISNPFSTQRPTAPYISPVGSNENIVPSPPPVQPPQIPSLSNPSPPHSKESENKSQTFTPPPPPPVQAPPPPTFTPPTKQTTTPEVPSFTPPHQPQVPQTPMVGPTLSVNAPSLSSNLPELDPETEPNTTNSAQLPPPVLQNLSITDIQDPSASASAQVTVSSTITEAIAAAADGAKILIPEGTYKESLTINKQVHLIGQGNVVLQSDGTSDTISFKYNGVVSVQNIQILQTDSQAAGAINISSGSVYFKKCTFNSKYMPTVSMKGKTNAKFVECELKSEQASIFNASQAVTAVFENSTISGSRSSAVFLKGQSKVLFDKTTLCDINKSAILCVDTAEFILDNESTVKNCDGSAIEASSSGKVLGVRKSTIQNCRQAGITAYMTASLSIVDSKIQDSYTLVSVSDGAAIRSQGTEYSNSTSPTQIYAYCHAQFDSSNDKFTGSGAGVAVTDSADVLLNNDNFTSLQSVGCVCYGENSHLRVSNSTFENNQQTAIICHSKAHLVVENTKIHHCQGSGIQLAAAADDNRIEKCQISECQKSGIEVTQTNNLEVSNTESYNNRQCGLLLVNSSDVKLTQNAFNTNDIVGLDSTNSMFSSNLTTFSSNKQNGLVIRGTASTSQPIDIKTLTCQGNTNSGLVLFSGANVEVDNSSFSENAIGISLNNSSQLSLNQTTIKKHTVGVQCLTSKLNSKTCTFSENKIALSGSEQSQIQLESGSFDSDEVHIETRTNSVVTVKNTAFSQAKDVGIHCTSGAISLDSVNISGSKSSGIATCSEVNIQNSKVEKCGVCGIYVYGGKGEIKNNTISDNGNVGIQVMSGEPSIVDNTISNHSAYGIHVDTDASPGVCGNNFSNNRGGNVNRD